MIIKAISRVGHVAQEVIDKYRCPLFISIAASDEEHQYPDIPSGRSLFLRFADTVATQGEGAFSDNDALDILVLVASHIRHADCVIVQCEVGISRSKAVAAALARILHGGYDDLAHFEHASPNPLVYARILANAKRTFPSAHRTEK